MSSSRAKGLRRKRIIASIVYSWVAHFMTQTIINVEIVFSKKTALINSFLGITSTTVGSYRPAVLTAVNTFQTTGHISLERPIFRNSKTNQSSADCVAACPSVRPSLSSSWLVEMWGGLVSRDQVISYMMQCAVTRWLPRAEMDILFFQRS